VTITTLGFADVIPHAGWLRGVAPLEALLGFGLLSASISWLLLIYPAISRRRSLAYEISLLVEAEGQAGVALERLEPASAAGIYEELAVERDLVSFPISYYFAELDERFALAARERAAASLDAARGAAGLQRHDRRAFSPASRAQHDRGARSVCARPYVAGVARGRRKPPCSDGPCPQQPTRPPARRSQRLPTTDAPLLSGTAVVTRFLDRFHP